MPDRPAAPRSLLWPALRDLAGNDGPPPSLDYRRAIRKRTRGPGSEATWLAATPDFDLASAEAGCGPPAGSGQAPPVPVPLWRSATGEHLAVNRTAGRTDHHEGDGEAPLVEQVIQWRRTDQVPPPVAALVLLPRAGRLDEGPDLEDPPAPGGESGAPPELDIDLPAEVVLDDLDRAVAAGVESLRRSVSREHLGRFYGELLTGHRPAVLETHGDPLEPAALAVLLLPLEPERAADLSLAGWVDSELPDRAALGDAWDGVAANTPAAAALATGAPLDDGLRERGERLAAALYENDPGLLAHDTAGRAESGTSASGERPIELAMWGTTSAGKTVFLAQLILAAATGAENDGSGWTVWPTEELRDFSREMRNIIATENHFPKATEATVADRVEYRFRHESDGLTATLSLEDRAGVQWQRLDDEVKARLESADGIVLVVDPESETGRRDARIRDTLDHLAAVRGARRDPRPLAVCLSKADLLIETPDDLRLALDAPEELVRRHLDPGLMATLGQYHADYRLFPVSAVGVRLRWGVVEPAVFYDETFTPRIHPGAQPMHLLAPFIWLLGRAAARRAEEAA